MSVRKSNSGYSLELVVGVQDLFSAGKKKIEKESRELDREFKDLQKTVKDVSAYQKAEGALNQLSKAENDHIRKLKEQKKALEALTRAEKKDEKAIEALKDDIEAMTLAGKKNTQATRAQEREFNRLSKSLKNTGVNLSDVINEERRLKTEVDKTTTALKKQSTTMNSMDRTMKTMENVGMIAGGVAATAGLVWAGNNKQQNEKTLAAQTGYSLQEVQSIAQREFRADLNRKYGASDVDIFESQAIAKQQNLSDAETLDLAESAIEYKSIFPETDLNMFNQAVANVSKSFGISIKDTANKIYAVTSEVGDRDGDILTSYKEYAPLLGDDVSIDQLNATIVAAKKAGVYNADVIFDSLKESFQARFSDQDEFSKLVGDGTKSGSIDNINDLALRKEVKDAAYRVRDDLSNGIPAGQSYANLLQSVQKVDVAQPGITKKLLEDIGGVRMSEDIGTKGVAAMAGALATPNNYLVEKNLSDAALDTRTALGTLTSSFTSLQGVVNTATGDLMEGLGGLADAVSYVSEGASGALNNSGTLSTAAVMAQMGALGVIGGGAAKLLLKKLGVGKILGGIGGTNASGASGLFGSLLKGGSKATSDAASDIASNAASKAAPFASSLIGKGASAFKGVGKLIPFVGTGLQSLSLASNINSGDTKNAWGDVGSMIGGWGGGIAGGVAGSFVMPGVGTVAGSVTGSIGGALAGEEIAEWLYSVFNSDEVAKVEDDVVNASQSSSLAMQSSTTPAVEFNYMPQINIQTGTSDAAVISDSLVQALRNMSPELQQQFKDTLNDLFNSGEYVES
ncbi:phage tail tape measure protein [Aliivibrio salmonicida]|uniref:phage tail tape measure protein n=1 Tax=Aliivibrio salmonicida TaxID=40269 RepID=UPI00406C92C9